METNTPLVSVTVITYNSSKFVIETLESIKSQTYNNIELIVSDDCSTDNTVELCINWLNANRERFVNVHIVTSPVNTGIPANKNRSLTKCSGVWLKSIAGDDVLMDNCIEDNVAYIRDNSQIHVLFSKTKKYIDEFKEENFVIDTNINHDFFNIDTAEKQYKRILLGDVISTTPSLFIYREEIEKVGFYDERFKLIEDYPMWLKLTKNGCKFYFMDKFTVKHRIHKEATNNLNSNELIKPAYFRNEEMRKEYVYPNLDKLSFLKIKYQYLVSLLFNKLALNHKTKFNLLLYRILMKYINPFRYLNFILRKAKFSTTNK